MSLTHVQIVEKIHSLCQSYKERYERYLSPEAVENLNRIMEADDLAKISALLAENSDEVIGTLPPTDPFSFRPDPNAWKRWLVIGILVLLTFPLSLPGLVFWSWMTRGTPNFLKSEGSVLVSAIISLCKQATTVQKSLTGVIMQSSKEEDRGPPALSGQNRSLAIEAYEHKPMPIKTMAEELEDFNQVLRMIDKIGLFDAAGFLESELKQYKGEPFVIESLPLLSTNDPNIGHQDFHCRVLWATEKEWVVRIVAFKSFEPLFPYKALPRTRSSVIQPAVLSVENTYYSNPVVNAVIQFGFSFFSPPDGFCSLMRKGKENIPWSNYGSSRSHKWYLKALDLASNDYQRVIALEALINWADNFCEFHTNHHTYNEMPEHHEERKVKFMRKLNGYLAQLPANYHLFSETANNVACTYERIWGFLERDEKQKAWELYHNMPELTGFIKHACPHLEVMWYQLAAIFLINGEKVLSNSFSTDFHYILAYLTDAEELLKKYKAPEAEFFTKCVINPLKSMKLAAQEFWAEIPLDKRREGAYGSKNAAIKMRSIGLEPQLRRDKPRKKMPEEEYERQKKNGFEPLRPPKVSCRSNFRRS